MVCSVAQSQHVCRIKGTSSSNNKHRSHTHGMTFLSYQCPKEWLQTFLSKLITLKTSGLRSLKWTMQNGFPSRMRFFKLLLPLSVIIFLLFYPPFDCHSHTAATLWLECSTDHFTTTTNKVAEDFDKTGTMTFDYLDTMWEIYFVLVVCRRFFINLFILEHFMQLMFIKYFTSIKGMKEESILVGIFLQKQFLQRLHNH